MFSAHEKMVLDLVPVDETVALLADLVMADSSQNESLVAQRLCSLFDAEGLPYEVVEYPPGHGNILARFGPEPGERPRLLFSAHMDSVPAAEPETWTRMPFGAEIDDGRLYGRGASDDKGGLAAMAMALVALRRSETTVPSAVLLSCVCRETEGNVGTRHLVREGLLDADFAVVGEYSESDKIANTYRGALWARWIVRGRTAHTGRAELGSDAIAAALDHVVAPLRDFAFPDVSHPMVPAPKLTVTRIDGGHFRASLPDRCEVTVDVRILPGQSFESIWAELSQLVEDRLSQVAGITWTSELMYGVDGFETPWQDPGVRRLADCVRDVLGRPPDPMGKVGMCDGNILANWAGIPTVAYGPGNPSGMGADEYCDLDRLEDARRVYTLLALRTLGGGSINESLMTEMNALRQLGRSS